MSSYDEEVERMCQEDIAADTEAIEEAEEQAAQDTAGIKAGSKAKEEAKEALRKAKEKAIEAAQNMSKSIGSSLISLGEQQLVDILKPVMGLEELTAGYTLSIEKLVKKKAKNIAKLADLKTKQSKYKKLYAQYLEAKDNYEKAIKAGKKAVKPADLGYWDQLQLINSQIAELESDEPKIDEELANAREKLANVAQDIVDKLKQSDMFVNAEKAAMEVVEQSKSLGQEVSSLGTDVATVATKYLAPPTMAGPYPTTFNPAIAYQDANKLKNSGESLNSSLIGIMSSLADIGVPESVYAPLESTADAISPIVKLPLP